MNKRMLSAVLATVCITLMLAAAVLSIDKQEARYYASSGRGAVVEDVALPSGTVDVNSASLEEIMTLPRIGEVIGQAIIDEREAGGPYYYPEDLLVVRGVGEKTLSGIREMLKLMEGKMSE